jgi:hypothetical protein
LRFKVEKENTYIFFDYLSLFFFKQIKNKYSYIKLNMTKDENEKFDSSMNDEIVVPLAPSQSFSICSGKNNVKREYVKNERK